MEIVNPALITTFYNLRNLLGRQVNWIVFATYSFLTTKDVENVDAFEKLFFAEILPIRPLDNRSSKHAIHDMSFKESLSKGEIEEIIKLSGGNPGLLRSLSLFVSKGNKLNDWKTDTAILARTRKIAGELTNDERKLLTGKIANKDSKKLVRYGFLNKIGKPFSQILVEVIRSRVNKTLNLSNLTNTQEKIWEVLSINKGKMVTRDQIAESMWKESWEEKYSDWAIDQAIYSLRQRTLELGVSVEIETKKGKGFILN